MNKTLESGVWTQSIIWGPREPFRDFTQLELHEQDMMQDERQPGKSSSSKKYSNNPEIYFRSPRGRSSTQAATHRQSTEGQVQPLERPVLRSVERRRPPSGASNIRTARRRARVSCTEAAAPLRKYVSSVGLPCTDLCRSIRPGCRNRRLAPSIDPPSSSL